MRGASLALKAWSFALLSTAAGLALAQSSRELGAEDAAWLKKQPAAVQRYYRTMMQNWRVCAAKFAKRSAVTEAGKAAGSAAPTLYTITSGGIYVATTVPGVCRSQVQVVGGARFVELDAAGSNPQDVLGLWSGPRQRCFSAATRFAEEYNRELVRLRPELASNLCGEGAP